MWSGANAGELHSPYAETSTPSPVGSRVERGERRTSTKPSIYALEDWVSPHEGARKDHRNLGKDSRNAFVFQIRPEGIDQAAHNQPENDHDHEGTDRFP